MTDCNARWLTVSAHAAECPATISLKERGLPPELPELIRELGWVNPSSALGSREAALWCL
jgi:hypothetical protein